MLEFFHLPLCVAWILNILGTYGLSVWVGLSMRRSLVAVARVHFGGLACSRLQMLPSYALLLLNTFSANAQKTIPSILPAFVIAGEENRGRIN